MKSKTSLEQQLSISDVAAILRCHVNTVRNLVNAGSLDAVHVGRVIRIGEGSVRDFLEANRKQPREVRCDVR